MFQILLISALLCACLTAGAQKAGRTPFDEPPAIVEQPETSKNEETKPQDMQNVQALGDRSESQTESIAGIASYYAAKFHGKRTASGEKFNSKLLTAAHQTLPFGTLLKVTGDECAE